jgi:catechol 2,3-dioxygenase-like lactoylglutathione lyase family enzyme
MRHRKVHTTLPASDLGRAKRWYKDKLDLEPATEAEGGIFYEVAGGTRFILYPTPNETRGGHTQIGFATDDIEGDVQRLKNRGVEFEDYDFPGLKTENHIATTGPTRAAWFKDSEGNMIGLVQLPPGTEPAD